MNKIIYIASIVAFACTAAFGQNFDPGCYFPTPGNGIDTIFRPLEQGWAIGDGLLDLGPNPTTGNQRIISQGIHGNLTNHTVLESGALINLKNLAVKKKWDISLSNAIFGHFHSTKVLDVLVMKTHDPVIYWADENGDFDTARHTYLRSSIVGNRFPNQRWEGFIFTGKINEYLGEFTSDSLDDIVLAGQTDWATQQERQDSSRVYVLLYSSVILKSTSAICYNDSSEMFSENLYDTVRATGKVYTDFRYGISGDFRGQGHKDFVAVDGFGNLFHYRNSGTFILKDFVKSLRYDTILSAWQNPHLAENQRFLQNSIYSRFAMRVMPKENWDHSDDYVARFTTDDNRKEDWFFFQGGADFGSKRLLIDSPGFQIHPPIGNNFGYAYSIFNCGDMTGTGNPVLRIRGNDRYSGREYYYVMGKAMDDKIEMSIQQNPGYAASGPVFVDADGDKFQDILYQVNNQGGDSLQRNAGSLWVVHGSTQIPVHLNPKYAVKHQTSSLSGLVSIYPNPANLETRILYNLKTTGNYAVSLLDILGRKVYHSVSHLEEGEGALSIQTEKLPQGVFDLLFDGNDIHFSKKIFIKH